MSVRAVAVLQGDSPVKGTVEFVQDAKSHTPSPPTVTVKLIGLTPGNHGFHVHEFGDNTNGCITAGGHYNPNNHPHASPSDEKRHVGDLGNLVADASGKIEATFSDKQISLVGPHSIIGYVAFFAFGLD